MGTLLIIFIAALVYFFPTILGWHKRNSTSIFLLNLFLGWSLIGWIVALIWATSKETINTVPDQTGTVSNELTKLVELKEKGILSEQEFQSAKSKLLK